MFALNRISAHRIMHLLTKLLQRLQEMPSNLQYKLHLSSQYYCWSFRCSWSIAGRRCSNYIFILDLTPGFSGLGKDNCKPRRESFKIWDLVELKLEVLR